MPLFEVRVKLLDVWVYRVKAANKEAAETKALRRHEKGGREDDYFESCQGAEVERVEEG